MLTFNLKGVNIQVSARQIRCKTDKGFAVYDKSKDINKINALLNGIEHTSVVGYDGRFIDFSPIVDAGGFAVFTPDEKSAVLFVPYENNSVEMHIIAVPPFGALSLMRLCRGLIKDYVTRGVFRKIFAWVPKSDEKSCKFAKVTGMKYLFENKHDFGFGTVQDAFYYEVKQCQQ